MKQKNNTPFAALKYLMYFTQFGITMITPPLVLLFLAWWLKNRFGWGSGIMLAALLLGIAVSICSLRRFMQFVQKMAKEGERKAKQQHWEDDK